MGYKIIMTLLLVLSLILTSCTTQQQSQQKGAFVGGTLGIVASFEPMSVLQDGIMTVFDTEDFPIDVDIKNKGEETLAVGDVTLRLLGPAKENFQDIPQWELKNKQTIEKISEFNLAGGDEIASFTPNQKAKYIGEVIGFTDIAWNLEYEYKYKTYALVNNVCFKGDITDTRVCTVKEAKQFSVSGAPITLSTVDEDSAGKGIAILKIKVKNAGKGKSTLIGKEFDTRFDQIGYVIDEPDKWTCSSGGRTNEARLVNGEAEIICRLKEALKDDDLYVKNIKLTLEYTYKELAQEKLRVKESSK